MRAKLGIMMGYALHTKGYRIWLKDENKLIETINVRFDENTKRIEASQNSNRHPKFDFTISDYSDYEDDLDTVIDSLFGLLIQEKSSESPSISREEPSTSTDSSLIPEIKWIRKTGREVIGADIYYGIEGKATHLKSFNEIEQYFRVQKIHFGVGLGQAGQYLIVGVRFRFSLSADDHRIRVWKQRSQRFNPAYMCRQRPTAVEPGVAILGAIFWDCLSPLVVLHGILTSLIGSKAPHKAKYGRETDLKQVP
ncbi:hypothetical protein AVEN_80605-1 [Araneus ventricosus]|uniref:Retroviral polymerase SH3-like domain-containing protein n=1 Tax=Araneus ventricosus TaxID=182803 RepID=A0A4Y2K955_ARAVE|nr:hypothetical protein AVEN_80605-1 [Araneus ventricosus]